jgi:hypothetical protein
VVGQSATTWNVLATGIVPFGIFLIAGTAELNRPPFDLVEAEQELVGGFHTEYSSMRFALFFLSEFMNMITMSAIAVTLFLGGPAGPIVTQRLAWVWPLFWFFLKVMAFLFTFVWLRATLPRLRYDQLMDLGWKVLIPTALGWFLLIATLDIARDLGWPTVPVVVIGVLVLWVGLPSSRVPYARQGPRGSKMPRPTGMSVPAHRQDMGRPDGIPEGFRRHVRQAVREARHRSLPGRQASQAGTPPRPTRAEPVRGRNGEVHRL